MRKVLCVFLFFIMLAYIFADDFSINGSLSVSPTSMGTVGVSGFCNVVLPPFFRISAQGQSSNLAYSALPMELYGSDVFGDATYSILDLYAELALVLKLGSFYCIPVAAGGWDTTKNYTIVRILEPGLSLPKDTSRFMDVDTTENSLYFSSGLATGVSFTAFSFDAEFRYDPWYKMNKSSERLVSGQTWPGGVPGSGEVVWPRMYWAVRNESMELTTNRIAGNVSIKWSPSEDSLSLRCFGKFSYLVFKGIADIQTTGYMLYRLGDGTTPVSDLPLQLTRTESSNPARVNLEYLQYECGLISELHFLKKLLNTKSSPELGVSYVWFIRKFNYDYLDDAPYLTAENWEEVFGFVKFIVAIGF